MACIALNYVVLIGIVICVKRYVVAVYFVISYINIRYSFANRNTSLPLLADAYYIISDSAISYIIQFDADSQTIPYYIVV